jgi:hypothetical protein
METGNWEKTMKIYVKKWVFKKKEYLFCNGCSVIIVNRLLAGYWWLMPVILDTQRAEIRMITVWSQPGQTVCKTLSQKTHHKKRAGGVDQVVRMPASQAYGPKFKPQWSQKTNKQTTTNQTDFKPENYFRGRFKLKMEQEHKMGKRRKEDSLMTNVDFVIVTNTG